MKTTEQIKKSEKYISKLLQFATSVASLLNLPLSFQASCDKLSIRIIRKRWLLKDVEFGEIFLGEDGEPFYSDSYPYIYHYSEKYSPTIKTIISMWKSTTK